MRLGIATSILEIVFEDGFAIRSDYLEKIYSLCSFSDARTGAFAVSVTTDAQKILPLPKTQPQEWNGLFFSEAGPEFYFYNARFACRVNLPDKKAVIFLDRSADPQEILSAYLGFLKLIVAYLVMEKGGILLHCSALFKDGCGCAFLGRSGSGKSTVAALLSPEWILLNDECNAIVPVQNNFYIYSTPFARYETLSLCNHGFAPLKKIFILEQAPQNSSRRLSPMERTMGITANIYINAMPPALEKIMLATIQTAAASVPVDALAFANTPAIRQDIHAFF
ncbi:MAG: hypothetical protein PHC61_17430 [Chitinivibrionales bacterium]|nr:hypothetical protein [Chitinivibrionales bacterium]